MCPFQTQDPLVDQGKRVTCLDQVKLRLALEVRSFPSSIMPNRMDKPNWLTFQTGSQCRMKWIDQVGWTFQTGKSI